MAATKTTTKASEERAESPVAQAANHWTETLREAGKAVAESAAAIQDSNMHFAQSLIDQSFKQVEGQTVALHKLYTALSSHSAERRGAFRELAREATTAYVSTLAVPARFARRGFDAVREAVAKQSAAED
ncbi:MAG TPA: hypothetical protein VGR57_09890 [Ktedonobacterales bacterium]|nr:hypothetical protein [Ktedonobacterales bacterium]